MKRLSNILGFKYLRRQRILTLTIIVALSSMLFAMTALILLGFYRGFTAYLGEGEDIVVVYDRKSRTPFTGLVPAYLSERISNLNGVLTASPEAMAPCTIKGEALFLRGIVPEEFTKLNPLTMVEGEIIKLDEANSAMVGIRAAKRLNIKLGEKILALGVLTDQYQELHVKGIFISNSPLDDEILTPLYVGQWLRGAGCGYVTLIRFKIDKTLIKPSRIFEEIAEEAAQPAHPPSQEPQPPSITPRIIIRFNIESIGVEEAYNFMKGYLDRYGATRESLLVLSAAVFLFSSLGIAAASKTLIAQHRGEIGVLRSLGASQRLLKRDLLLKLLPWTIMASLTGITLAVAVLKVIQEQGYLQVLFHAVPIQIDPFVIALNLSLIFILSSLSILRSEIE
ncbi:MAG: FtsX-like permease family protein [Candidatus Bathyarchaeia archaeon]